MSKLLAILAPRWKAVGAFVGGLTPAAVVGILAVVGVHVDPTFAAALCVVGAPVAAYIFPANKPKATDVTPAAPVAVVPPQPGPTA